MTRILLADDDQVLSDLLTEFLTNQQLDVTQVFDGQKAVDHIARETTDMVILDVMMPVMDGFEALREIRKNSQVPMALVRRPGVVISKEELTEKGLSRKLELYDRSVDMHISNLRKKLGKDSNNEQRIKTVRGIGYLLAAL